MSIFAGLAVQQTEGLLTGRSAAPGKGHSWRTGVLRDHQAQRALWVQLLVVHPEVSEVVKVRKSGMAVGVGNIDEFPVMMVLRRELIGYA